MKSIITIIDMNVIKHQITRIMTVTANTNTNPGNENVFFAILDTLADVIEAAVSQTDPNAYIMEYVSGYVVAQTCTNRDEQINKVSPFFIEHFNLLYDLLKPYLVNTVNNMVMTNSYVDSVRCEVNQNSNKLSIIFFNEELGNEVLPDNIEFATPYYNYNPLPSNTGLL